MKIRASFVSNSSSASFVVRLNGEGPLFGKAVKALTDTGHPNDFKFPTPKQIAIEMLTSANGKDNYNGSDEHYSAMIQRIETVEDDTDYIAFPSINYETEIFKIEDGRILVQTCNNQWEDWEIAIDKIKAKYPDAEVDTFGEGDEPEDFDGDWNIWCNDIDNHANKYFLHFNYLRMRREGKKVYLLKEDQFYKRS
jgi:hypothetical protein